MTKTETASSKLQALRDDLMRRFPERQAVIDGCLISAVAAEHVLIIGPPGTAKSALARAIAQAFGARYFERLLTKFSLPDEVFGPVSLRALEQDKYERVIDNKLPTVEFGFIDECFKANSAILNSLLTLMNERKFHNGDAPMNCPLVTMFGASNELPDGLDLEALSDRFMMKFEVKYITQAANFRTMLKSAEDVPSAQLTMDALRAIQKEVAEVKVTDATIDGLIAIRGVCETEGITASDRRWKKCQRLVQASAWLMGNAETNPEDLAILVDILWREPNEREKISRIVHAHADPNYALAVEVLNSARDTGARVQKLKGGERSSYIATAVQALEQYSEQQAEIKRLTRSAGKRTKRAAKDALGEIDTLVVEAQRATEAIKRGATAE